MSDGWADLVTLIEVRRRAGLDGRSPAVLDRLASEDRRDEVLPAFSAIPRESWMTLIDDCLTAEREAREHKRIVTSATARRDGARDCMKQLDDIAAFLGVTGWDDPRREALQLLRTALWYAREDAERTLRGHSRKTDDAAARRIAVGWIKDAIRKMSGAPNLNAVADLAAAVLGFDGEEDISADAVRKAPTPRECLERALNTDRINWTVLRPDGTKA